MCYHKALFIILFCKPHFSLDLLVYLILSYLILLEKAIYTYFRMLDGEWAWIWSWTGHMDT